MTENGQITAKYDSFADVLYVSSQRAIAERAVEDEDGIVWRYDTADHLIGATILDLQEFWLNQRSLLESKIAEHFGISPENVHLILTEAFLRRTE